MSGSHHKFNLAKQNNRTAVQTTSDSPSVDHQAVQTTSESPPVDHEAVTPVITPRSAISIFRTKSQSTLKTSEITKTHTPSSPKKIP